jgi:CheY-like chemotaxis protein
VNEGTKFRIYLPALLEQRPSGDHQQARTIEGRGEHILYIDDEPALVELLRDQLVTLGYRVTAHRSPVEALSDFRARPHVFDVVLTDLTMPGMSGADLAEEIFKVRPDLPIVITTGYGDEMTEKRSKGLHLRPLLYKPFSMTTLGEAIQDALASVSK